MAAIVLQALAGFLERRNVPLGNPPQHTMRLAWLLEPVGPLEIIFQVTGAIDELLQVFGTRPDRHVHQSERVLGPGVVNVGGVAGFCLQAPNETGRLFRQAVDMVQAIDKLLDFGMVQRMQEPGDIQLGEVEGHEFMVPEWRRGGWSWYPDAHWSKTLRYNLGVK